MFAYCGNNPVSRKDDGGEFWSFIASVTVGAVVGAAFSFVSELSSQVIYHIATGEDIDWGAVGISTVGGAVYGGTMVATGSKTAATAASTITTSVITGISKNESVDKIVLNTVKNTALAVVSSVIPDVVNESLSGKYLKLNKLQQLIKRLTDGPYQGKYESGPNYLVDVIYDSSEDLLINLISSTSKALR